MPTARVHCVTRDRKIRRSHPSCRQEPDSPTPGPALLLDERSAAPREAMPEPEDASDGMKHEKTTVTRNEARRQFESLAEAAERTGLSICTLRRRIAEGRLPAYRSGPRLIRVSPDDVDRLMTPIPAVRTAR